MERTSLFFPVIFNPLPTFAIPASRVVMIDVVYADSFPDASMLNPSPTFIPPSSFGFAFFNEMVLLFIDNPVPTFIDTVGMVTLNFSPSFYFIVLNLKF